MDTIRHGYADYVIGDYMTEAVLPIVLHQDPRYFRRGTGNGWLRLDKAVGQIFLDPQRFGPRTIQFLGDRG